MGLLQSWLEEDFALLAGLEGVKRAARDWDANAKAEAWLAHQGQRLAEAQGLDARPDIAARLDALDRTYLAQCLARQEALRAEAEARRREREEAQARRLADARRIVQRTVAGLIAALVLAAAAGGFGLYALNEKQFADHQTLEAERQSTRAESAAQDARAQRDAAEVAKKDAQRSATLHKRRKNRRSASGTQPKRQRRMRRRNAPAQNGRWRRRRGRRTR